MTRFIEERSGRFGVELLCRTLGHHRPPTTPPGVARPVPRAIIAAWLHEEISRVFEANYRVYGARKLWHQTEEGGHPGRS